MDCKTVFESLFDASPDGIVVTNRQGLITLVNARVESMFGYGRTELIGQPLNRIVPDGFPDTDPTHVNHYLSEHGTPPAGVGLKLNGRRKDGNEFPLDILLSTFETQGDVFGLAVLREDTGRPEVEEALRESEERFRLATHNVASGLYTLDPQGLVTYVNPSAAAMLGWTRAELLGRKMHDTIHHKHPDGTPFPDSECPRFQVLQEGIELLEQEDMFIRKDGSMFPVVYSASRLKRGAKTVGIVVGFRDDTQRQEAVRAMRQSAHELQEAQRLAHVGSWHWEVKKDVVRWSEELYRIAGRDPSSGAPSYKEHSQLYTAGSWTRLQAAVERTLRSGESYEVELEMVHPDGTTSWITGRGEAVRNAEGVVTELRGTVQDITERKRAEEALSTLNQRLIEAHEEERARIARELHDDINQRVALLAIHLDGIKQMTPGLTAGLELQINKAREGLRTLGKDIQALSHRVHSSRLDYLGLQTAAAGLCMELSEQYKVQIAFYGRKVPIDLSKEVTLNLFRVLQESLQNAIRHSGSSYFQVTLSGQLDEIQLTVQDTGSGFDVQEAMKGSGLGLVGMQERLKLVNGHLSIVSRPEVGTTIHVRVPARRQQRFTGQAD